MNSPIPTSSLVSVVIVLWNSERELTACLRSVTREAASVPLEVFCIDNGSKDASVAVARQHGADVIELGRNLGFPAAVNVGLARCRAPFVVLLNPDVELAPGTLIRCLDRLRSDSRIGVVGCNLRRTDGSPDWAAARRFRSLGAIAMETFGLTRLFHRLDFQYLRGWDRTTSRDVECINGAFMLLSTELLRRLGGLDESVFMYLEDQELCRRLATIGLRVHFVAEAIATHVGGASTLRASSRQQTAAYLHRLDADIEIIARLRGSTARLVAVALFATRAGLGLAVGIARRDPTLRLKYRTALGWLAGQARQRCPPPPVP